MAQPKNLQYEWARLIIDGLASQGVSEAIISPGSRSTPFVCAALEHPRVHCTSVLDERSAAHFALGQARATGMPSVLICTSGSAAANYFPAVVEASESRVPLIVLTADRPPELHHCGANQTTDQLHLYGARARFFANVGEPLATEQALRAVRRTAIRAVAEAVGGVPGPVHINAQAREPLEPRAADDPSSVALQSLCDGICAEGDIVGAVSSTTIADTEQLDWLAAACARAERGLIVCGPAPVTQGAARDAVLRVARLSGFPIVAEAASQFRFMEGASKWVFGASDALWRSADARASLRPDLIVQVGDAPVSKGWSLLMQESFARQHVLITEHGWPDPTARATRLIRGAVPRTLSALSERLPGRAPSAGWHDRFMAAQQTVSQACARVLGDAGEELSEGQVAARVVSCLPEGAALVLGNSLPIRQVDGWAPPAEKTLDVFSQRGVSGIDGVVSEAVGVASQRTSPTLLLVGDVSFLHDVNGLQAAAGLAAPCVIVVVNNRGGRIFEQLPIAESAPESLPFFTTPHDAALDQAAGIYRHRFHSVNRTSAFVACLEESLVFPGCTVIEARVPDQGALRQNKRLWYEVERRSV